uniref:Uncharacterized protein n=1 Tax=Romanomermis culicivorax TaxID=13658 RepID=A0A915L250_ROMCU
MEKSVDDSNQGSSRIPKFSALPKKGILKRSGSVNSPHQQHGEPAFGRPIGASVCRTNPSTTTDSPSDRLLPWLSSNSASKIPKLSVTWWETSSAYGGDTPSRYRRAKSTTPPKILTHSPENYEQHQRSLGEEYEDVESVTSCGGSSIAGTWWFGRDTRFVPHCQKHKHSSTPEQYLTPTQRKNREITLLKKQLRDALRVRFLSS